MTSNVMMRVLLDATKNDADVQAAKPEVDAAIETLTKYLKSESEMVAMNTSIRVADLYAEARAIAEEKLEARKAEMTPEQIKQATEKAHNLQQIGDALQIIEDSKND